MKKKMFDNSNMQGDIEWGNIPVGDLTDEELHKKNWNMATAIKQRMSNPEQRQQIGDSMRGKSLEELIGKERAEKGRISRSRSQKGIKQPEGTGAKIAAKRRETGSYDWPDQGMRNKKHKESTKELQSIKAKVRQDLKRKLKLGKSDSIPKDILLKEYKRLGLDK
jgi:hypothetical protein